MRDGLHKSLPLEPRWKSALRRSLREADRPVRALLAVELALSGDVRSLVSVPFWENLKESMRSSADLLPGMTDSWSPAVHPETFLEQELTVRATACRRRGVTPGEALKKALSDLVTNHLGRRRRQLEQHCLVKGGVHGRTYAIETKQVLARVDVSQVADRLFSPSRPAKKLNAPVDPDENLMRAR